MLNVDFDVFTDFQFYAIWRFRCRTHDTPRHTQRCWCTLYLDLQWTTCRACEQRNLLPFCLARWRTNALNFSLPFFVAFYFRQTNWWASKRARARERRKTRKKRTCKLTFPHASLLNPIHPCFRSARLGWHKTQDTSAQVHSRTALNLCFYRQSYFVLSFAVYFPALVLRASVQCPTHTHTHTAHCTHCRAIPVKR